MLQILIAFGLLLGPYTSSGNIAADLYGIPDTRANTWGRTEATSVPIKFKPPAGYRVRVLSLRGDLVSWPRVLETEKPVDPGRYAGTLLGFSTTAPEGSVRCDLCADNCMLYIQDAVSDRPSRAPFQYDNVNILLEPDHTLVLKLASWLNTTGHPIHIEGTWTAQYRFEKATP